VYPQPEVTQFIVDNFEPVRVHVKHQAEEYKRLAARFNEQWTPTVMVIDPDGEERHRIEGFLPPDEFLSQLKLGLAKSAFARSHFAEAERRFREIVALHPATDAAPESLYWAGVANYKGTGDGKALQDTYAAFRDRYQQTTWAQKASVWG
jgi:TolA-binding protein